MKKVFLFLLACALIVSAADPAAWAFGKKAKQKKTPPSFSTEKKIDAIRIFETPEWMVLFSIYPLWIKPEKGAPQKEDPEWREVGYKLVDRTGEPGKIFGQNGWVEIRFQDKDGFNLMAAPVHFENPKTEYYGFARIEKSKAGQIARVRLDPLKDSEIPQTESPPAPAPSLTPSASPTPSPASLPALPVVKSPEPAAVNSPVPSAEPAAAVPPAPQTVSSPEPFVKPKPVVSDSPAPEAVPNGIITNDVIQKTLQELEKSNAPAQEKPQ